MKTKILFTALTILASLQFTHAQYLVSAIKHRDYTASEIRIALINWGFDTEPMDLNDVTLYVVTYNTTGVFGEPTVASGALWVPLGLCDTLPLVSYQHGTQFDNLIVPSNRYYKDRAWPYSANGYITVLPDYLGLGVNPGLHPYVHWESEATASIDLIRAAREYLVDSLQIWDNNQLFLTGYSQGGHSTMAIHKYIKTHNLQSEFNVVASAPLSGPFPLYDVQLPMMYGGDSTYYAPEFLPYIFASYNMVYGNLYENFNEYYDPPYDVLIANWLAAGTDFGTLPTNFYDFMQDSVLDNIQNNPNHPFNIDLRDNDLHNWIPEEPVRMLYCGMDSMVFPLNSIMAKDTMIALGAPDVQAINLDWFEDHDGCFIPAITYALDWFDSLNAGCYIVTPYCMQNGAVFSTQAEIDNFPTNNPYCIEIGGDVEISGSDITNLDGLSQIKVIDGNLEINNNEILVNLSGLDNLESIRGNLKANLNNALTEFTGIENLRSIDGKLVITSNPVLTSLTGLDSIESGSIHDLYITYNDNLSYCNVVSICEYLADPDGNVSIHDNAPGCNSKNEVEEACFASVKENSLWGNLKIHPNPFSTSTTIEYKINQPGIIRISIYNQLGRQVEVMEQRLAQGLNKLIWAPVNLPPGIYYFRLQAGEQAASGKMVLMR